jgi:PAS domain S-box-containing protein
MDNGNNFESIRHKIADRLLLAGLIVSVPAAIASGYRITTMGVKTLFIIDILIAFVLTLAYFTRNLTNYRIRMAILLGYVFMLGWVSLNTFGLFGFGLFIMFFTIIITTTFFGLRYGLLLLGLSTLIMVLLSFSIYFQWIHFQWDFNQLSHSPYQWFSRAIFFISFATMAVVTLGMVHKYFERANRELAISEDRFNLALDSVNEVIWEIDMEKKETFVSKKFFEILHFAPSEMAIDFNYWRKLIHEEDISTVNKKIGDHIEGRTPNIQVEYRIKNKWGSWQWILTKGKIISWSPTGKPIRVVGTHTDIGPRKEMERILRESEQRYRMLFMSASDTILLVENDVVIDCNESTFELLGMTREQLIGIHLWNLCPIIQPNGLDTRSGLKRLFDEVKQGESTKNIEWEFERLDGKSIDIMLSINLIMDNDRALYQIILHDVSERKQFEQAKLNAVVETEERERLKLAGDLHDDVGPLLSSLNMYLSLLGRPQTENRVEIIDNMQSILRDTISSVREISTNLSPHALIRYGLAAAINGFLEPSRKLIEINFEENIGEKRFHNVIEITCYRIVKEMLNNTLKYAQANSVNISINSTGNMLFLSYNDNGVGFNFEETVAKQKTGIGLLNILNRLSTMKAIYTIDSKPNQGFHFDMKLRLPECV